MATASGASYFLGFWRDILLAHFFGASAQTDAFATAFLVPDLIFNLLIAGATGGVLMPAFLRAEKHSVQRANRLFANFFFLANAAVVTFSALAFLAMPAVIGRIFVATDLAQRELIVSLARILLASTICFSLSGVLGSVLLARERFLSWAISPVFNNAGILLGIFLFAERFGIHAAAWGSVLGAFLHFAVRLFDFRALGLSLRFSILKKWNHALRQDLQNVLRLAAPKTVGLLAFQLFLWGFNFLGYFLQEGAIAAFSFARNLQSFAVSLFGIALATSIFPGLAASFAQENETEFSRKFERAAGQILFFTLPAAVGLFLLADDLVQAIFTHGNFDANSAFMTTTVLRAMAVSVPAESLTHLLARGFLARGNTIVTMWGQIIFFTVTFAAAFFTAHVFGIFSLGAAFAAGCLLQVIFLLFVFHRKFVRLDVGKFLAANVPTVGATIFMAALVRWCESLLAHQGPVLRLTFGMGIGALIFFAVFFLLTLLWGRCNRFAK